VTATHLEARAGRSPDAATGPGRPGVPTLGDVQREFPGYRCWCAVSGLFYARPCEARAGDPAPVKASGPLRLREAIIQHRAGRAARDEAAARDAAIEEILVLLFGSSPVPSGA
jgi:hypothetical protein